MIKNKAKINEENNASMDLLKADIRRLKKELAEETSLRMSLEAKLDGMPKNAVATDSAGGSESA